MRIKTSIGVRDIVTEEEEEPTSYVEVGCMRRFLNVTEARCYSGRNVMKDD